MNKKLMRVISSISASVMAIGITANCFAQIPNDTTANKIRNEVVEGPMEADSAYSLLPGIEVTGSRSFHSASESTYIPTRQEKNGSMNAMSLLDKLMIPQIAKDANRNYKALNGADITYFINGHPALPEELSGMNVGDVKKVVFLSYPSDSRYMGAQYVIDFIMQEYQYGGYTIFSDSFYFLGETHFQEAITSKFTFKRMTYDMFVSAHNFRYKKAGVESHQTYMLDNETVTREDIPRHSELKTEVYPIKFRAVYSHGNAYISNEVGVGYQKTIRPNYEGEIRFGRVGMPADALPYLTYDYSLQTPLTERLASWKGYASFLFDRGWSLSASSSVYYSRYDKGYTYITSEPFEIERKVKENSLELALEASLTKKLGSRSSLGLNVSANSLSSHSHYRGNEIFDNTFSFPKVFGRLSYSYNSDALSLTAYGGVVAERNKLNDYSVSSVYPYGVINIGFSNNRKTQYSLWMQYSTYSPLASRKNPTVVRENEIFYRKGNPDLKPYPKFEVGPSFTWSPSDEFTLGASAMFTHLHDIIQVVYTTTDNGSAILESFANRGNSNVFNSSLFASLRLFNSKLSLSARPDLTLYRGQNIDMPNLNSFSFYGSAQLYLGKVVVGADFMCFGKQYMSYNMTAIRKRKPFYEFTVRWGSGPWKVGLDLINIFQTSWEMHTDYIYSPLYNSVSTNLGIGARQTVIVGFSYTLGYGKKIERQNELEGGVTGASSAVM